MKKMVLHDLMRVQITKISVYFFFTRCPFSTRIDASSLGADSEVYTHTTSKARCTLGCRGSRWLKNSGAAARRVQLSSRTVLARSSEWSQLCRKRRSRLSSAGTARQKNTLAIAVNPPVADIFSCGCTDFRSHQNTQSFCSNSTKKPGTKKEEKEKKQRNINN